MKNAIIIIAVVTSLFFLAANLSQEKALKLGHINSQELLEKIPEVDSINKKLQKMDADNNKQLEVMSKEYEQKLQELQALDPASTPESVQNLKYQELIDLQNRVKRFQAQAQQDLEKKRVEWVQPILTKVEKAIDDVAVENNYDYIFDTSYGTVLHSPDGDNVLELVKKKLNVK